MAGPPAEGSLALCVGDPTVFGLGPPEVAGEAVAAAARMAAGTGQSCHGYGHSAGTLAARTAVADYLGREAPEGPRPDPGRDVWLAAGCSGALQLALASLAREGGNVLLPCPAFPLYRTMLDHYGVEARYYSLDPAGGWEADPAELARLADEDTCAVLVCNPGNPTGHSYSRAHLVALCEAVGRLGLPLLCDEVYSGMAFGGSGASGSPATEDGAFTSVAEVCGPARCTCLIAGALSKRWLAPGWRLGWLALYDEGALAEGLMLREALGKLCQITLGPCSLVQAALPRILADTPQDFFDRNLRTYAEGARLSVRRLEQIPGLSCPSPPQGAMYLMVKIDLEALRMADDVEFSRKLQAETGVGVLPGSCFGAPGFCRIVTAAPASELEQAWDRLKGFMKLHYVK